MEINGDRVDSAPIGSDEPIAERYDQGDHLQPGQVQVLDALAPAVDLFGPVDAELSVEDVKRAIRGVVRPRDLRPLITKSTHDPLMNMLELAMKAKNAGADQTAFERFAECLPYVWTRVASLGNIPPGAQAGEVTYRWAMPGEQQP
jgi:hypothetical protein